MKKTYTLGKVTAWLALYGLPGLSGRFFVLADDTNTMPSTAGEKLMVGYWHNRDQGSFGDYTQGYPLKIALKDIPKEYNVMMVSFMKSSDSKSVPTFIPYYDT
ncbi:MAG: hypothetical protein P4L95_15060 [Rouxiella aceris]|uniref:hypothetical protein n=1 Tax=Rouxiella aceris TaxID=2703884 RepID=UPI0028413F55|nr:hypothetical protein [Rouxiella aceris]MDR3433199.1 hypothetical protein [Rouxiella aceris]